MSATATPPAVYRRGLHLWAGLVALVCFPLVFMGGLVTSSGVGMVDDTWTFTPFKLLTADGLREVWDNRGMLIEHGHRQLGFIVGMLAIVLAVWCGFAEKGKRRWLGLVALLAVGVQGALGAFRIKLNALFGQEFAMVHGILGQLVFTTLILVEMALSRTWIEGGIAETVRPDKLRRLALLTAIFATCQLIAGAALRHFHVDILLGVHLFFAVAVAVHVFLVLVRAMVADVKLIARPALLLACLLGLQIALGFAAWHFGGGTPLADATPVQLARRVPLTTAHQATGALFLATAWLIAARAAHHLAKINPNPSAPVAPAEKAMA